MPFLFSVTIPDPSLAPARLTLPTSRFPVFVHAPIAMQSLLRGRASAMFRAPTMTVGGIPTRTFAAAAATAMQGRKIKVDKPVVSLDGDEMTRIIWRNIQDRFIHPFLDIDIKEYDLGIQSRDATDDRITVEAAEAILEVRSVCARANEPYSVLTPPRSITSVSNAPVSLRMRRAWRSSA